jgi:hypothetical protein
VRDLIAEWRDQTTPDRPYTFIAALIWNELAFEERPDDSPLVFDAGSFQLSDSWNTSRAMSANRLPGWSNHWDVFSQMLWISGSVDARLPTEATAKAARLIEEVIGAMLALDLADLAMHSNVFLNLDLEMKTVEGEPIARTRLPPARMNNVNEASFPPLRTRELSLRIVSKNPEAASRSDILLEPVRSQWLKALFASESNERLTIRRACRQFAQAVVEPDLGELFVRCSRCLENLLTPEVSPARAVREFLADGAAGDLAHEIRLHRGDQIHTGAIDASRLSSNDLGQRALDLVSRVIQKRIAGLVRVSR